MLEEIALTLTEIIVICLFVLFKKGKLTTYLKRIGMKEAGLKVLSSNAVIKLGNPLLTIMLPVLISIPIDPILSYLAKLPITAYDLPLFYLIIQAVFVGPIFEEIFFRGTLFGAILTGVDLKAKRTKYFWYIPLLIFQAWLFMAWHTVFTFGSAPLNIFRFVGGFLYGLLYIAYGRNLVPCIAAHSASNLLVLLITI